MAQRLRKSDCTGPGIARRRRGKGFEYLDADGERVTDREVLDRINELVIPPAWEDVWICPYPGGHIQATGVDDRGRKQYLYHPRWRERQDQKKFDDMVVFARALPALRERVAARPRRRRARPRPRPRMRGAAAGPRLLPDRLRGLRRHERDVRARDHAQAPRRGGGRHPAVRLPGQERQAPRAGRDRPGDRRHDPAPQAAPWRGRRAAGVQARRPLGGRALARHQHLPQGSDRARRSPPRTSAPGARP